jgi:hypothetical protein
VLGVAVGTLLLVTNARTWLIELDVAGSVRLPILLVIGVAGAALAVHVRRQHRRAAAAAATDRVQSPESGRAPEPAVRAATARR